MPIQISSSEAQQNFGRIVDQALIDDDVIIERYGKPRVVLVGYQRYQQLLHAERTLAGLYLAQPGKSIDAKERGQSQAAEVRRELQTALTGTLEETMASLRGRS